MWRIARGREGRVGINRRAAAAPQMHTIYLTPLPLATMDITPPPLLRGLEYSSEIVSRSNLPSQSSEPLAFDLVNLCDLKPIVLNLCLELM